MTRSATLLILISVIVTSNCCKCCSIKTIKNFPKAEVKFLGMRDVAVQESSKDAAEIISSWSDKLSTVADAIPYGKFVSVILSGVSKLTALLDNAEAEMKKYVDQSLGKQAIVDIEAKLVTIQNRLKQVEVAIEKGGSYTVPISIAENSCDEILQKFAHASSYLYISDNYMLTSPSLVNFAGVYAGVTGFSFVASPDSGSQAIKQMRLLKGVLEKYRDATVSKRMSYFQTYQQCGGMRAPCIRYCNDLFFDVTACESCSRAKCQYVVETGYHDENRINYWNYEKEMRRIYTEYFDNPLKELQNLISTFERKMSRKK